MKRASIYIIALLAFATACHTGKVVSSSTAFYPLKNDTLSIDSTVYKMILPYKVRVDAEMNAVIAISDTALPAPDRKIIPPESLLGNFLADLFLKVGTDNYHPADGHNIDFVLINTGGVRTSLPKGNITTGNVFEVLPFDNRLTVVTLSGDSCISLFNYLAKKGGDPVSGLRLGIKDKAPAIIMIQGEPFTYTKTYKVLTNDFCAAGGDNMWFFTGATHYDDLNIVLRDAVINELKTLNASGKHIIAALDHRIYNAR